MNEMVVVDTSAWIYAFSKGGKPEIKYKLAQFLDENKVVTTGLIMLELLQGTRSQREYDNLLRRLQGLHYIPFRESYWLRTSRLSFSLQRKGLKIPTTDLLIAIIALENNCLILHQDKHFTVISQHSQLKLA